MKKISILMVALICLVVETTNAQFTVLYNCTDTNSDIPTVYSGRLTLSGSMMFGTFGNDLDSDYIFSMQTNGGGFKYLYHFPNIGVWPCGHLTLSGDTLFGMTSFGGADGYGTIFSIDADGSGYKDLFDFNDTDGGNPLGSLILVGNTLYGMAESGGTSSWGCLFSIREDGNGFKVVIQLKPFIYHSSGDTTPQLMDYINLIVSSVICAVLFAILYDMRKYIWKKLKTFYKNNTGS